MCFGSAQTSTTNSSQTTTPSPWLTSAAANNVNFAQNLQNTGFTPYSGNQVAAFNPQQAASFSEANNISGAVTPNLQLGGGALSSYLNNAGSQPTVTPETISSQMSPYMNQYVSMALQPQLQQAANAYMLQSQAQQGNATSAGAFGDPREAQAQTNLGLSFGLQNQGLVGNAYNAAFNTAIGAGAQDVSNNLNAQTTNAGLYNTGLQELLAGSNAANAQGTGAANLLNTFGAQQTAQSQAGLNAAYNQWLMAQQYPFQTSQLLNSDLGAAQGVSPVSTTGTSTTSSPNNSGWGMLGSVLGAVAAPFTGGLSLIPGAMMGAPAITSGGGKADGGPVPSDEPTLIGERGPELFVPHKAGTVIPYETLKAALDKKQPVSTQAFQHDALSQQLGVPAMALGGAFGNGGAPMGPPAGMVRPPIAMPQRPPMAMPPAQNGGGAPGRFNPALIQQLMRARQLGRAA
jgi:hypothetical protein